MVTCCKDCISRHFKCHSTCKTYLDAVKKAEAEKESRKAEFEGRDYDANRSMRINKRMDKYRKG